MPSLNALRAFEAAARHLSFKHASNELNVTQGAVGQQVKLLEETLGVRLFDRLHKSLRLTDAGQRYLPTLRGAFRQITEATERLVPNRTPATISVGVEASFAVKWLLPRLTDFRLTHAGIDVEVSTAAEMSDLVQGRADIVIRYGLGHFPGFRVDRVAVEERFPVCSPSLLSERHGLAMASDLRFHTLLHDEFREGWTDWLRAHSVEGVDITRGPRFNDGNLVLEAAMCGQGVALGRSLLVERDIGAGRLVKPFSMGITSDLAYYLLSPEGTAECYEVMTFRHWLLDTANLSPVRAS